MDMKQGGASKGMEHLTTVREIYRDRDQFIGKTVKVGGWIRSIRDSKHIGFIVLHDGTFFEPLQIFLCVLISELFRKCVCSYSFLFTDF